MRVPIVLLSLACIVGPAFGAEPTWHPFIWRHHEVYPGAGKVKAAIMVPIKVNGVDCLAQLDTGAPDKLIWHRPVDPVQPGVDTVVALAGRSMTVKAQRSQLAGAENGQCMQELIASVGNAFFDDGTLTLDLKNSRLAFSAGALLASEATAQPFGYTRSPGREGAHIIVDIALSSGKSGHAMFDTGAALFGMSAMDKDGWSDLTGAVPLAKSAAVTKYQVHSWGKQITCYAMTVDGSVDIAKSLRVAPFHASYCAYAFQPAQKLFGLLGLRHLNERVITIDYVSRRWLIGAQAP